MLTRQAFSAIPNHVDVGDANVSRCHDGLESNMLEVWLD